MKITKRLIDYSFWVVAAFEDYSLSLYLFSPPAWKDHSQILMAHIAQLTPHHQ